MNSLTYNTLESIHRGSLQRCLVWVFSALMSLGALGQVRVWDNGGSSGNWGTASNWSPNDVPDSGAETAQFGSTGPGAINQDVGGGGTGITVGQIHFAVGGIARTISGNTITINAISGTGLLNNSSSAQSLSTPIVLGASQTWDAANGNITVSGAIQLGSRFLTVAGANNTTLSSSILGTGGITKTGSGTLTLSGANTYSGVTTVSGGTLIAANSTALGATSGDTTVASGSTLALQGNITIGNGEDLTTLNGAGVGGGGALLNLSGNNRWRGNITLGSSSTITSDAGILQLGIDPTTLRTLNIGANTLIFDGAGSITNNMRITGSGNVVKRGSGTLTYISVAANTYTGSTTVEEGVLALDNLNNGNAAIVGPLIIGDGVGAAGSAEVQLGFFNAANEQIANAVSVTINEDGRLRLNGQLETFGALTMTGGAINMNQFNAAGASVGTLTLGGNVTGNAASSTATIAGNLNLGAGPRTFNIANGAPTIDMAVSAVVTGTSSLIKTGAGVLELSGANAFTGAIDVNGGTLRVNSDSNLGNTANTIQFNGGTLNVGGTFTATATRTHTANAGGATLDIDAVQTYSLNAINQLTGSGAITKQGGGTLVLGNTMNFSGPLAINDGTVRNNTHDVLNNNVPISIAAGATLDLNNFNDTVGPLSFTGGTAQSGSGTMTLNGDVTGNASSTTASISGQLDLGGSTRIFSIADGAAGPDMDVSASISGPGLGLIKTGAGTLQVSGVNSYTGETDIQQGTLLLGASHRFQDSAPMKLSGGTFGTGGNSDDLGTLTLAANSLIDLGSGSSILNFDASQSLPWTGGTLLTINNWSGNMAGGGIDRVIFGSTSGALTASQVAQIRFQDPFGAGSGLFAAQILPTGEVVPIPEPTTVFSAAALLAAVGWRERKRIAHWLGRPGSSPSKSP